jgi:hypothetical protein
VISVWVEGRRLLQEGVPLFIHFIKPSPSVSGGAKFLLELLPECQKLHCRYPQAQSRTVSRIYLVSDTVLILLDEDATEE